jgi:3'-phosphoadenosine 5'-phosphosulfate sulfotransferase (PAPS reductase)/FAD synthetase
VKTLSPREFVQEYAIKSMVCCFSGGKDSLVATHYVMSELEGVDIDKYVVFVDTTVMVPSTAEFVKDVCAKFGWNLKILSPEKSFWEMVKAGMPMPTMRRRWCCYHLKLKPIIDFTRKLPPQRAEITGLRSDESIRRQKMNLRQIYLDKRSGAWHYAPILSWTEKDVLHYMKTHGLPMPPHYRLGIKETCQCGAFSSKKQLMILKAQFPELFQKFLELEKNFKKGGAAFYFDNKPCYAKKLAEQKTLQEFG